MKKVKYLSFKQLQPKLNMNLKLLKKKREFHQQHKRKKLNQLRNQLRHRKFISKAWWRNLRTFKQKFKKKLQKRRFHNQSLPLLKHKISHNRKKYKNLLLTKISGMLRSSRTQRWSSFLNRNHKRLLRRKKLRQ